MDLNLFAREMLRAEGGNANMDAVLAALDGDKDAVIQALWLGRSVAVKDDRAAEDVETLRKGIADVLGMPIGCFMNDGWQKEILECLNGFRDDADERRDRMDVLRHVICLDLFDLTPDDYDGREHELADRLKALNNEKDRAEADRDTLRDGIARVLGVPAGEFCDYGNWATDMVTRLVAETDDAHNTYTMFHHEIVNALGGGVATEEQILQKVKQLAAKPDCASLSTPPLLVCPPTFACDPRVAALEAEIETLKEKAAVDAIMAAQGKMPVITRLQEEVSSLRTILFAHESREMLLQADLRRAQEALRAAGQPVPQEASANSRVPAIPHAPADTGRPPTWLTADAGFGRAATSLE